MAATKTSTITVTGTLEKADLTTRAPFMPTYYGPARERLEYYLDCCLRLPDGSVAYFKTPAVTRTVASCPGAAIVLFDVPPSAAQWVKEEGTVKVATVGHSNNNQPVPLVRAGDTITISGRVKAERVSKRGNLYKSLTHVKRVTVES